MMYVGCMLGRVWCGRIYVREGVGGWVLRR